MEKVNENEGHPDLLFLAIFTDGGRQAGVRLAKNLSEKSHPFGNTAFERLGNPPEPITWQACNGEPGN